MLELPTVEKRCLLNHFPIYWVIDEDAQDAHGWRNGASGAKVLRLKRQWQPPVVEPGYYQMRALHRLTSVIVKYGKQRDMEVERRNYSQIPPDYQPYFAAIAAEPFEEIIDDELYQFLLIEDLVDYRPLNELIDQETTIGSPWLSPLLDFLSEVYTMPVLSSASPKFSDLYLAPISRSLARLRFVYQQAALPAVPTGAIEQQIAKLTNLHAVLEPIPPSFMHGDLNLGNIMVQGEPGDRRPLRFRLIDLDKFTRAGDLAIDIGELVVELEHSPFASTPWPGRCKLSRPLEIHFTQVALANADVRFPLRLALAKARSLLKLTELYARQIMAAGLNQPYPPLAAEKIHAALRQVQIYLNQADDTNYGGAQ